jgi:hypothetical protein
MSPVGFEPTAPGFKWVKAVHTLDCGATVIGSSLFTCSFIGILRKSTELFLSHLRYSMSSHVTITDDSSIAQ